MYENKSCEQQTSLRLHRIDTAVVALSSCTTQHDFNAATSFILHPLPINAATAILQANCRRALLDLRHWALLDGVPDNYDAAQVGKVSATPVHARAASLSEHLSESSEHSDKLSVQSSDSRDSVSSVDSGDSVSSDDLSERGPEVDPIASRHAGAKENDAGGRHIAMPPFAVNTTILPSDQHPFMQSSFHEKREIEERMFGPGFRSTAHLEILQNASINKMAGDKEELVLQGGFSM